MHLNKNIELFTVLLMVKLVSGVKVLTKFQKLSGDGVNNDSKCAANANDKEYLATMIEASNMCTKLDWSWASNPTFEIGATYYKKKQVVEVYEPPRVQTESMVLPITFVTGSYIDMYITPFPFVYCAIRMTNTLDISTGVKYLISMAIKHIEEKVVFKTFSGGWKFRATITPYPFRANVTHKITFQALPEYMQVLLDDELLVRYQHITSPRNARMLTFDSDGGILLHKVHFTGM